MLKTECLTVNRKA